MTLTPEQLDELEAKLRDPHEYPHGIGTRTSLHLVAVYRAALAWSEARAARQGVQTRAGLAETSDEHNAAMSELPAAKEADVLATMALMSALVGEP